MENKLDLVVAVGFNCWFDRAYTPHTVQISQPYPHAVAMLLLLMAIELVESGWDDIRFI